SPSSLCRTGHVWHQVAANDSCRLSVAGSPTDLTLPLPVRVSVATPLFLIRVDAPGCACRGAGGPDRGTVLRRRRGSRRSATATEDTARRSSRRRARQPAGGPSGSSPHRDRGRSRRRHRGPNRYGPGGRRGSKRTTPASVNCAHDPKRAAHPGLTARKDLYVLICPSCHFLLTQLPSEDRRLSRASATSAPPSAQPASPRRLCRLKWLDS